MRVPALLLLALTQVHGEWVQISQQNYRKTPASKKTEIKTKPTEPPQLNKSVASDYLKFYDDPWGKANVYRVHNIGTVKRVHPVKAPKPVQEKHDTINRNDTITENIPPEDVFTSNNNIKNDEKSSQKENKSEHIQNVKVEESSSQGSADPVVSEEESVSKENRFEDVLRFLKVASETITNNARRSVSSKLHYLHELRDSLLYNIEAKIDETWPDDDRSGRRVRSAPLAEQRGHVEFPSSEGALMTISFLTFAVFLIKLVLQVIQTYKNKTMMMTPAVVAVSKMDNKISP